MITMRSNTTKVTKPPPPVPPRPSKNVVAEALAKSRKFENGTGVLHVVAPPVVKSQSYSSINKYNNVVPKIERGVSVPEPPKPATRTLIYQSSNVKQQQQLIHQRISSIEEITVNVNRKESIKRECNGIKQITRTSSFKSQPRQPVIMMPTNNNNTKVDDNRDSSLESLGESEPISRSNSFKTEMNNSSDSVISEDEEGNWNHETKDRNHVNTLIDEMFASVLDLPECKPEPVPPVINDNNNADDAPPQLPNESYVVDKVTIHTYKAESNNKALANESPANNHDSSKTIVVIETGDESKQAPINKTTLVAPSIIAKKKPPQRKFDDKFNHELLISELSSMKRERQISKRQRNPSETSSPSSESRIQHSDWVEVNNGKEIRLSSCQITIDDDECKQANILSRLEMANLHGLPPLPKSLSGFNIEGPPQTPSSIGRTSLNRNPKNAPAPAAPSNGELSGSLKKPNNLDAKLALLRREMYSLRQLDLSLLSQLWSLNESIQDFRHMLQEQDERNILSPPSPSPTTSSGEDVDGDDYFQPSPMRFRLAPPPPPPHRRTSNSSSGTGSSV